MFDPDSPLDDSLLSTIEMLWCAFERGITADEYWPLIAVLVEALPREAAAKVMYVADARIDYTRVIADTHAFTPSILPNRRSVDWLRERLAPCGYDAWLAEHGL